MAIPGEYGAENQVYLPYHRNNKRQAKTLSLPEFTVGLETNHSLGI